MKALGEEVSAEAVLMQIRKTWGLLTDVEKQPEILTEFHSFDTPTDYS